MKRPLVPLALALALASSGCYGSYSAFHALHKWNGQATESRVANSFIHFGLYIIPVYELAWIGDWIIFNNVEFFTNTPVF